MHVRKCGKLNPNYQHSKNAYVKGKNLKKYMISTRYPQKSAKFSTKLKLFLKKLLDVERFF